MPLRRHADLHGAGAILIDRAIAFLGLASALLAWLAPLKWPKIPKGVLDSALFIGGVLVGVALSPLVWAPDAPSISPVLPDAALHLSSQQKDSIAADAIAPPGGPHVVMVNVDGAGCEACQVFAEAIRDILNSRLGWRVFVSQTLGSSSTTNGAVLFIEDTRDPPPAALVLEQALQRARVPFRVEQGGGPGKTPGTDFVVNVGPTR